VVIGGGDTAMDCLRTAIRYGAHKAVCIYRRGLGDLPCGQRECANAVEEGAEFVFCAAPLAVLGNDRGEVTGLRLIRTELSVAEPGKSTRFVRRLALNWNWKRIGLFPLSDLNPRPVRKLATSPRWLESMGGIQVDANQMTSLPAVFAGGDIVHGPAPSSMPCGTLAKRLPKFMPICPSIEKAPPGPVRRRRRLPH